MTELIDQNNIMEGWIYIYINTMDYMTIERTSSAFHVPQTNRCVGARCGHQANLFVQHEAPDPATVSFECF